MSSSHVSSCVRIMGIWILCGVAGGMLIQLLRLGLAKQQYQSQATFLVTGTGSPGKDRCFDTTPGEAFSSAATIIESLASSEIRRRALERLRVLNPELKECEVTVRCSQLSDSGLFQVSAIGEDKVYIRHFLNAELDEYLAFRQSIRSQTQAKFFSDLFEEFEKKRTAVIHDATTPNSGPTADKAYTELLDRLGQFRTISEDAGQEAVFERAKQAAEAVREWAGPLLMGSGLGFVGGFILFYLFSSFLAVREIMKET